MSSISENVDDRLSMLPEETVSQILSLMPTKYAVRTSVLSRSWRYTWTLVTNLDFDDTDSDCHSLNESSFIEFVDKVLKSCETSHIKVFRLYLCKIWDDKSSLSTWIDKAVTLNVRELDIGVNGVQLPLSMLTCKTLTKLRLTREPSYNGENYLSSVNLPCLKTLDIAYHCLSLVDAFKLIRGCPVLESLSLKVTCGCKEDYIFDIPTLKMLKLTYYSSLKDVNKVVLCVPNLEYLIVSGVLCSVFAMEDLSSLVGASIACRGTKFDYLWDDLLNTIRGVESLSIHNLPLTSALPIFPNMKHLELKGYWQSRLIPQFLGSCPELKILCIDILGWISKTAEESYWIKPKSVPACMLTSLTTIKLSHCTGQKSEIEFWEYMLGNASVLKTVTIAWMCLSMEKEKSLRVKLLELPRASMDCKIHF